MKPATPLPWGAFSLNYAQPAGKNVNQTFVNQVEDEQYALHAANAYPELVAALRSMMKDSTFYRRLNEQARNLEYSEGPLIRQARALLAKLGEG